MSMNVRVELTPEMKAHLLGALERDSRFGGWNVVGIDLNRACIEWLNQQEPGEQDPTYLIYSQRMLLLDLAQQEQGRIEQERERYRRSGDYGMERAHTDRLDRLTRIIHKLSGQETDR